MSDEKQLPGEKPPSLGPPCIFIWREHHWEHLWIDDKEDSHLHSVEQHSQQPPAQTLTSSSRAQPLLEAITKNGGGGGGLTPEPFSRLVSDQETPESPGPLMPQNCWSMKCALQIHRPCLTKATLNTFKIPRVHHHVLYYMKLVLTMLPNKIIW